MKKLLLLLAMITSISWSYAQTLEIDSQTNVTCNGNTDGAVTVKTTGGTAPYTYEWDNGLSSDSNQINLAAGTYTVTVTDDDNNKDTLAIEITEPTELVISFIDSSMVTCYGGNDGMLTISVTGGTAPYTYNWSNGEQTDTIINLTAGEYSVTVTDNNGCSQEKINYITEPMDFFVSQTDSTMVTCNGGNDGIISIIVDGETNPYTYNWSNGEQTDTIINLTAGEYNVTVTDNNGCTKMESFFVTEPDSIMVYPLEGNPVSCFGGNDGMLIISTSGGISPYTYNWSNGEQTDTITILQQEITM